MRPVPRGVPRGERFSDFDVYWGMTAARRLGTVYGGTTMNRFGQILLVFGLMFMGLVIFDAVRTEAMDRSHLYQMMISVGAVIVGGVLLRIRRGA